jgi:signal peptidase I
VALFVLTFVLQPLLIPSESMERTLLVGDFLLFNKQTYAPPGLDLGRWLLPYRPFPRRHHRFPSLQPPMLIKRVVGIPGDRLRIAGGQVFINGVALDEPYAAFEPAPPNPARDNFPGEIYSDPLVDPEWWRQMQSLTSDGELTVPQGEYFVWRQPQSQQGLALLGICAAPCHHRSPLVIYFSLDRPLPPT